ncbi:tRNA-dihydrouridine(16/17) synthase [NAD(P)(+)]-like protein [Blyttiomyces sp. JEL0837]|nr:tRNA-dihydrouridine(16/17) synthase [NAD(P)(+)]-like protein [Blyttiomyces sp. JEL0837]
MTSTQTTTAAVRPQKLKGFEFYEKVLKSPKRIVAPMVDQSEYAWRILSRRYNSDLCYTPMFHARLFAEQEGYREENFTSGENDRPLIVQFCANDAQILLRAAKLVENDCEAVDINLGCPQHIAKRGHYGSFLMDEWDLIADMVRTLDRELAIPVTCKIRVFPDVEKTIQYAKMLEAAGCQLLTVHGRLREMKGHKTGLADWEQIKRVKQSVNIPVFANGNVLYGSDVDRCFEVTGVDGVMTAEGNLYNPAIFLDIHPPVWKMAEEYLQICTDYPNSAGLSAIRAHLFKVFAPCLHEHTDLRTTLAGVQSLDGFKSLTAELKGRILKLTGGATEYKPDKYEVNEKGFRILPSWVCQPHFRPELPQQPSESKTVTVGDNGAESTDKAEEGDKGDENEGVEKRAGKKNKRSAEEVAQQLAAKKARRANQSKGALCSVTSCSNVASTKCSFGCCKGCCRLSGRDSWTEDKGFDNVKILEVDEATGKPFKIVICEAHKTLKTLRKEVGEGQSGDGSVMVQ